MKQGIINRRTIIKMGLAAGTFIMLPIGCLEGYDDKAGLLLKSVGDSDLPISPEVTGELTKAEFDKLSSLCKYVNKEWKLVNNMEDYLLILKSDLRLKTSIAPSYLTEYRNAISLIDGLNGKEVDFDSTWYTLLFTEYMVPGLESTKLGRARKFAFSEIVTHFVPISGAFKTFSLWNYPGHFGGSFLSDTSYRKIVVT